MSNRQIELTKSYNPQEVEDKWYHFWESSGYFKPDPDATKRPFCIVIPPPNITGSLHMGHAMNVAIQDIFVRWKRMSGHRVLWLPGTDHAGIATQNVVEKELSKEGVDRHKLGRDAFIKRIWEWKAEHGGKIIHQIKRLGASCDWSRERFTLDEGLSKAVREVFVTLYEEGLIYRDNRLINWCPRCHTALSDLEVEYDEIDGKLYYIKYPLTDGKGYISVATTRPETMLGDTAVAVHPEDERYGHFIGKTINLPLVGREIPIISESSVDPSFATGAVKVTPAHDFSDEAIGRQHNLPSISVITEDGRMGIAAGERYSGLDRYRCRKKVLEDLIELGLLEGEKRHNLAVGHCYRCKTTIEPLLTIQWYVAIESLASEAIKVVRNRKVRLIPESWENNYFAWMRDIKDWCISRQIWWGHQIPVWYCADCKRDDKTPQGEIIEHIFFGTVNLPDGTALAGGKYSELRKSGMSHTEIIKNSKITRIPRDIKSICRRDDPKECPECRSRDIIRDPDVLDTWFSSALWPFSTLGWPEDTEDLRTFYPTNLLVTGFDILFFWVARMIMMGMKFMGDPPFRDVYIHALVRDLKGQKMSKSKGNIIDPLLLIDKYGADAFRFSLAALAARGRDIKFSEERIEGYRHFINKLWNATKFIINNEQLWTEQPLHDYDKDLDLPSRWIISRLASTASAIDKHLREYRFSEAANGIYQFVWHEFCDWYIELTKPVLLHGSDKEKVIIVNCLFFVLEQVLQLLHPFMPFVTEEIWHKISRQKGSIIRSPYPLRLPTYQNAVEEMGHVINAVTGIRSIRGELNIAPSIEIEADIKVYSEEAGEIIKNNLAAIKKLTRCKEIGVAPEVECIKGSAVAVKEEMEIYVPIGGLLDIGAEVNRLQKEMKKIDESLNFLNKKLLNADFLSSAPKSVLQKDKARFDDLLSRKDKIEETLKLFDAVKRETTAGPK